MKFNSWWSKETPWNRPGVVHPREYNWREQFSKVSRDCDLYDTLDVGKVIGLCKYIDELEELNRTLCNALKLAYKALTEGMKDIPAEVRSPEFSKMRNEARKAIRRVFNRERNKI